jgi:hypothetical protein
MRQYLGIALLEMSRMELDHRNLGAKRPKELENKRREEVPYIGNGITDRHWIGWRSMNIQLKFDARNAASWT